ncbi:MAG: UDP-N-acetylglucosamine diphosphorylase [Verrucomicrobia bacterium]|nr:UDP-N-acetylglucosamine diphosphorylase [Verrucomicrobiota bacterium]MCF7709163.1 UDP-N-acetylglucosamine diphosphorylase [Verrucomicrobiota bacterium]
MIGVSDLFDLSRTEHAALFEDCEFAWDALKRIKDYVGGNVRPMLNHRAVGNVFIGEAVSIGEGTVVEDGAMIRGPAIIGRNCQIRHNAYIRDNVIIGDDCVIGNACELKNAVVFNNCQVPHFNYVGDSILGYKAHLGAGVKISNIKIVPGNVSVLINGERYDTGLRKFGALLGDHTDVGCNAVLNPGSIISRNSVVYANTAWRGFLPENHIAKLKQVINVVERRTEK